MRWNYLSILKLKQCNHWILGMDKSFHPMPYWACDYLWMLGFKLIHVSKRAYCYLFYSMCLWFQMCDIQTQLGNWYIGYCRADPRFVPSQWETLLQSNAVSHWLGTNLESALVPKLTIPWNKQRVLMHGHQGWNVRHGLCHIYMIYVYIWVVYSFCLFCCLFVTTQFVALYKPCKPKPKFR